MPGVKLAVHLEGRWEGRQVGGEAGGEGGRWGGQLGCSWERRGPPASGTSRLPPHLLACKDPDMWWQVLVDLVCVPQALRVACRVARLLHQQAHAHHLRQVQLSECDGLKGFRVTAYSTGF